jgi:secernin
MCDTWVALADATQTATVIFAKNSDRPIFDCQPLRFHPRQSWPAGSAIKLEYRDVPQVECSYASLGSGPYWCWGYEEGLNEFGVAIGNEAIFTKTFRGAVAASQAGQGPDLGLLGMDLVRLALERSQTAGQAVEVMGSLIEQYGQFGSGVPTKSHIEGGYDNSFIVADPDEAWIVEAVGQRWAARRIRRGAGAISNQLTIRTAWDAGSLDLEPYAKSQGWWPDDPAADFDFARAYTDEQVSRQVSHLRLMRSRHLLAEKTGQITPQWMMRIARDHYEDTFLQGPYFDAADPDFQSICMHVSAADFTWGNTASSCVVVLPQTAADYPVFWWTPGPPCNGCYVPFFVHGRQIPEIVSRAGSFGNQVAPPPQADEDEFAPDSYWWLFRQLMDTVKGDPISSKPHHYQANNRLVRARFDPLEAEMARDLPEVLNQARHLRATDQGAAAADILDEFRARCVNKVVKVLRELLDTLQRRTTDEINNPGHL